MLTAETSVPLLYPQVKRNVEIKDDYHGTEVVDPYRWLENPHSIETRDFIINQNEITNTFLSEYSWKDQVQRKVTSYSDYQSRGPLYRIGGKYYQMRNSGLLNQDVLYIMNSINDEGSIFFDPNKLSRDGSISLAYFQFSHSGEYMAYALSTSGSEWVTIKFKNTRTGQNLKDSLYKSELSKISWDTTDSGIFYSGYLSEKNTTYFGISAKKIDNQKLYFHRLDTDQEEDTVVAEFPDSENQISGELSHCRNFLIVYCLKDFSRSIVYIANLKRRHETNYIGLKLTPILHDRAANNKYITNVKTAFLFTTDFNCPNGKVISTVIDEKKTYDIISGSDKHRLEWAKPINFNHLVLCYLVDGGHNLSIHTLDGTKMLDINLGVGTIVEVSGNYDHNELFFLFSSFLEPNTLYRLDFNQITPLASVIYKTNILGLNIDRFQTKLVEYKSKDGTLVPMHLFYKRNVALNGSSPCILNGCGGFGKIHLPRYHPLYVSFVDVFDGVFALANVRGGGEFGGKWHEGGKLLNKQNSFDDYQYAAMYLVGNKFTNSEKLIAYGHSVGGLLVGTSINQMPSLFKGAVIVDGLFDMLRYDQFTCGYTWKPEFGTVDNKIQFLNLYGYSPIHNIQVTNERIKYTACLLLAADHDSKVVPLHSLKFVAELQYRLGNSTQQPLLFKMEFKCGHSHRKPTTMKTEESNNILNFIGKILDLQIN